MAGRLRFPAPAVAPEMQGVTFVELFFDLVFVFALTQVTKFTVEHLTWAGAGRAVLVFWLIWWAWTQFTWSLNPADTDHPVVRVGVLTATGLAFLMAVAVDDAFGDGGFDFVVPYVAVRVVGMGMYAWVASAHRQQLAAVVVFNGLSALGLTAALIGGAVDTPAREWLWVGTIVLDLVAAGVAGRLEGWDVRAAHFAERHGLFVIIALGESLVVAGIGAAELERTGELLFVAIGSVVLVCLLWWTYFGWLKEAVEQRLEALTGPAETMLARDAYSFLHFPLIGGVIGIAVGIEEMVAHPGDALHGEVLAAFVAGLALFVGAAGLSWWRASGRVPLVRFGALAAVAVVLALARDADPGWVLVLACAGIAGLVVAEREAAPA